MVIKMVMLVSVIAITSTLAFAQSVQSRHAKTRTEREIERLEQQRFDAYLKLDAFALDRIMSDNYTSVYANGQVMTKAQELAGIKSAPPNILSKLSATIDELSVRHFGSSAVLSGTLTIKGTVVWYQKEATINAAFRYTAVYAKKLRHWRIVASQYTQIDPADQE